MNMGHKVKTMAGPEKYEKNNKRALAKTKKLATEKTPITFTTDGAK